MIQLLKLETKRLILTNITLEDGTDTYLSWLNDIEVTQYTESCFEPHTKKGLINFIELQMRKPNSVFLSIKIKEINKHIGNIKIDHIHPYHKTGEYGIMIGDKSEYGKGYAKEASIAIINHSFNTYPLRKINLAVVSESSRAINLYKSLGFAIEGIGRESFYHLPSGKFMNGIRMGLFKTEWKY